MREVDIGRNLLILAGKSWDHEMNPCCKAMIGHLVRRECYCSWFQPMGGSVFDQFPAIRIGEKYFTLSLRVQKAMFRHVRLTKNFNNVERLPDGNLKLRIPTQLLMEKQRTASRFNVMRSKDGSEQPCKRARLDKKWNTTEVLDITDIIDNILMPMKDKATYTTFGFCQVYKVWDTGAAYISNYQLYPDLQNLGFIIDNVYNPSFIQQSVLNCFSESVRVGTGTDACLLGYLTLMNTSRVNYFLYSIASFSSDNADYADIDGCEVFTGPAQNPNPAIAHEFSQCLSTSLSSQCQLPQYIWSGRTSNRVPIASLHAVSYVPGSQALYQSVQDEYDAVAAEARALFTPEVLGWSNTELDLNFFSMEGDVIHQLFDCYFLGPFSAAELWPSGGSRSLQVLQYYRSSTLDRTFQIPSAGCDPAQDACCPQVSPFSCGGPGRMAIIHSFIQTLKRFNTDSSNNLLRQAVQNGVRAKLRQFRDVLTNTLLFGCQCGDGTNNLRCCKANEPDLWTSKDIQGINFDILETEDVLSGIYEKINQHIIDIYTNVTMFNEYSSNLTESQKTQAKDESLFDTSKPILRYDTEDILDPKSSQNLWQVCTNVLSQTFAVLPLNSTLDGLALDTIYSAYQHDATANPSSAYVDGIEETVQTLLSKAKAESPFYHGFRGGDVRYMPSKSQRDMQLSDVWGIVSDTKVDKWAAGVQGSLLGGYDFDWADLLTHGTSGLRLANMDYLQQNYPEFLNPSSRKHKLYNADTDTSAAIEDCIDDTNSDHSSNGFKDYVKDLARVDAHFRDHLMPMARTVHSSSTEAFCSRFVLELARLEALLHVDAIYQSTTPNPEIGSQRTTVDLWRLRCVTQVRLVSLCNLHGIYDIVPSGGLSATFDSSKCPYSHSVSCTNAYATSDCLVYCDGVFHDPCLCASLQGVACKGYTWSDTTGTCKLPIDPRTLDDDDMRLSTMTVPTVVPSEELQNTGLSAADMQTLASSINTYEQQYIDTFQMTLNDRRNLQTVSILGGRLGEGLLAGTTLGSNEHADALLDYWPSHWIHPTGYHVTTGCRHTETAYRAFDTWMSVDYDTATDERYLVLDTRRLQNETLLRNYFGAASTCSSASYGMPMWETNNVRLQSRWASGQRMDPTQPIKADTAPSGTFVQSTAATSWSDVPSNGRQSDQSFPSSGMLYRWWPGMLPAVSWPQSSTDLQRYRLPNHTAVGWNGDCGQTDFFTCTADGDCVSLYGEGFKCLRAWSDAEGKEMDGVCVVQNALAMECYQNYHCGASGRVCTGMGTCVDPHVMLRNYAPWPVEMHVNSEACGTETLGHSPWQNSQDFLSRHGLCGFRSWFEYEQLIARSGVAGAATATLANIPDDIQWPSTDPYLTDAQIRLDMFDRGILKMEPHTCDMDYQFQFPSCVGNPSTTVDSVGIPLPVEAQGETTRTWVSSGDNKWSLQLCKLGSLERKRTGFLAPYQGYNREDSFGNISLSLSMCSELQICFLQDFYVMGYKMQGRLINRLNLQNLGTRRDAYTLQDALYCGSAGYLVDLSTSSTTLTDGVPCRMDPLTNPIARMLCEDYDVLKASCQFNPSYINEQAVGTLCRYYKYSYALADRNKVASALNDILLRGFKRGFNTWEEYQQQAVCIANVYNTMSLYAQSESTNEATQWYAYEFEPGVPTYFYPYMTLYFYDDASQMEIPMKWWAQCVILDGDVNIDGMIAGNIDQVPCAGWKNSHTAGYQPSTVRQFLMMANALYLQSSRRAVVNQDQIALSIYDTLYSKLLQAQADVTAAMGYSSHPEYINLTYVQLRKLQSRYNHDWAYNQYTTSSDVISDSTKITNTDPVYQDDGGLPADDGIPALLTQVLHFILSGDINLGYAAANSGVNRTARANLAFQRADFAADFLSRDKQYFDATSGILQYNFPNIFRRFLDSELDSILSSVLREDEPLEDFTYGDVQYNGALFRKYQSLIRDNTLQTTACLYSNFPNYEPGITKNLDQDPEVRLCDSAQNCRSINVCNPTPSYDQRTGQSCDLLHASQDDRCTNTYLNAPGVNGGNNISMQTHCKQFLFVRDIQSAVNPSLTSVQFTTIDLDVTNPAGDICLRTDSTCLRDSQSLGGFSTPVDLVQSVRGVDIYVFYRDGTAGSRDPNADEFYSAEYPRTSTRWYPAWVDCFNVTGVNKSHLLSWTGWDAETVGSVQSTLNSWYAGTGQQPNFAVLSNEAIWSRYGARPTGVSTRCSTDSCTTILGSVSPCPGKVCNVARDNSLVHAIALHLQNATEIFCASSATDALSKCPLRSVNQSVLAEIMDNLWICKSDCARVPLLKYIGKHLYRYRRIDESVLGFTSSDRNYIGLTGQSSAANGYTQKDAFRLMHFLVSRQITSGNGLLPSDLYNQLWITPDFLSLAFMDTNDKYPDTTLNLYELNSYRAQAETMRLQPLDKCINQIVKTTECTPASHRESLKSCLAQYKRKSASVADLEQSVLTKLTAAQVTSMHSLHWAKAARPSRDQYLDWVLSDMRCEETLQSEAVCYRTFDGYVLSLNPWLGGGFNIRDACDTVVLPNEFSTVISGGCKTGISACTEYNSLVYAQCITKNNQPPSRIDILSTAGNNLCNRGIRVNTTCLHEQGSFGGGSGTTMEDLYTRPATSMPYSGIFGSNPNPAFQARSPQFGILRQSQMDIGGSLLVADLAPLPDGVTHNLLPKCLPLAYATNADTSPSTPGIDPCASNNLDWLKTYAIDSRSDYDLNAAELGSASQNGAVSWDCPVREMHYWGGSSQSFRPKAPYGPRAATMFSETNQMGGTVGNGMSNPMQPFGTTIPDLADPFFVSEICSCSSKSDCSFLTTDTASSCGLYQTVDLLTGNQWKTKQSYAGTQGCKRSLDWPNTKGVLRDGTDLGSAAQNTDCPVHDRLREFQLRYLPVSITADAGITTLDAGGECHTGRLVRVPSTVPIGGRCHRYNFSHLECSITTLIAGKPVTDTSFHALDVPSPTDFVTQFQANHRRTFQECQPSPQLRSYVDRTDNARNPVSSSMRQFTSFGVPVRLSLSRTMAQDLRRQICGNSIDCPLLDNAIDPSKWTVDSFLQAYLQDFTSLFQIQSSASISTPAPPNPVNDSKFWDREWVFCSDSDRYSKPYSNRKCYGSIPKETWLDPKQRFGACRDAMSAAPTTSTMIPIRIWTLDSTMNNLSTHVASLLQRIQAANCKAAGVCVESRFLYNPSAYSISNQAFVTQTVLDFYQSVSSEACSSVYTTQEIQAVIAQNNNMKKQCAAEFLVPIYKLFGDLRQIVQTIVKLVFYAGMMGFNFMQLLLGINSDQVMPQVMHWFNMFINEARVLFEQIGNMVFELIRSAPFGDQLMKIIKIICTIINWFLNNFFFPVICPILHFVGDVCTGIGNALKTIHDISIIGIKPFTWIVYQIYLDVGNKLKSIDCNARNVLKCDIGNAFPPQAEDGTLPTPTRCWASYITSVSDGARLSCSASDTCLRATASSGSDTMVCDACPYGGSTSTVARYGCDPIRKQCMCNVMQTYETPCMTHEQCVNQIDATCVFMNSDIQPTFGNIPCAQCTTQPMCILQPGKTYGSCSCFLTRVDPQGCSISDVTKAVAPKLSGLCLAQVTTSMGGFSASSSATYTISYNNLLATPCYNSNYDQVYCYSVFSSFFSFAPMLVSIGISGMSGAGASGPYGRRLLGLDSPEFYSHDATCMDAYDEYLLSNRTTRVFVSCITRFAATYDVARRHGIEDRIPPNMFVSLTDLMETIGNDPTALLLLLYNPTLVLELGMQTSIFQRLHRYYHVWTRVFHDLYYEIAIHGTKRNNSLHYRIDIDGGMYIHGDNISETTLLLLNILHSLSSHFNRSGVDGPLAIQNQLAMKHILSIAADGPFAMHLLENITNASIGRHLLQTSWQTQRSEVKRFTASTSLNDGIVEPVGAATSNAWVDSPFAWPVNYDIPQTLGSCALLSNTLTLTRNAFGNVTLFYTQGSLLAASPRKVVSGSWPLSGLPQTKTVPPLQRPVNGDWISTMVFTVVSALEHTPFNRQFFYNALMASPGFLQDFLRCDRSAVMLCSKHKYTLLVSGIVVGILLAGTTAVITAFQIPYVSTFLWGTYPVITSYYAFGVSPFCAPMIPTCFIQDFVDIANVFFPSSFRFPDSLQTSPGCLNDPAVVNREACIIPCSDAPFEFNTWESEIAWWTCFISTDLCRSLGASIAGFPAAVQFTSLNRHISVKAAIIDAYQEDMINAQLKTYTILLEVVRHSRQMRDLRGIRFFYLGEGVSGKCFLAKQEGHALVIKLFSSPTLFMEETQINRYLLDQLSDYRERDHIGTWSGFGMLKKEYNRIMYAILPYLGVPTPRFISFYQPHMREKLVESFQRICRQLARLHSLSVYHTDIRNHNIVINEDGSAYLIDWGNAFIPKLHPKAYNKDGTISHLPNPTLCPESIKLKISCMTKNTMDYPIVCRANAFTYHDLEATDFYALTMVFVKICKACIQNDIHLRDAIGGFLQCIYENCNNNQDILRPFILEAIMEHFDAHQCMEFFKAWSILNSN
ncbi:hypothetical protein GUITHDRAFT_121622 [Guillardia theta CCMP2712]|uniref:Protein kinase domain-containing protein n=1 Tax=Guillardia theta (strain CCMP2712) TaxID=905079 RepID=L1I8M6_GUITC|nr:hypothetical protein GUITHDRAFT_121622 [Guillardia theta CCMP2712]EKX32200.1 hypothetical protein GUITHDRAFT_121622 [Guillardia theta CCMP2712]|eukprot:XP_005819180.1 hypothetical protein GUITHDRAFT_121622 [Guillardia theta CCMP2712]